MFDLCTKRFELYCEAFLRTGTFVLLPSGSDCLFHYLTACTPMDYVKSGNAGLLVSPICLGTMSYGGPTKQFSWALPEAEGRKPPHHSKRQVIVMPWQRCPCG